MSRKCELSGVGVLYGNKVSHSQRKTRRRFEPNIRVVRFKSDVTGQEYKFMINAKCIRSVEKVGGFDEYMVKVSQNILSDNAKYVRRIIIEKKKKAVV